MTRRILPETERVAVPLAAFLALDAYTWIQSDPAGRGEGAFLTLLTTGVLAVIAALGAQGRGRRSTRELTVTAVLATATVWIAYQGPSRGAAVSLVLLIGLVAAAARVLLSDGGRLRDARLNPGVTVALAVGFQLLMRGELLLEPLSAPRTLVSLLVLPAVAGWAVCGLAARFGAPRALLAGGLAMVLAPGWTLTSTFAVAALAAGTLLGDKARSGWVRGAAAAALALLPLWSLPKGMLFAVGGLALGLTSLIPASLALVAVAAVAVLSEQAHVPLEVVRLWAGALALVPAAVLAAAGDRWPVRLGAILALAGAMVSPVPEAMAAGVAAAALGLPAVGAAATLQRAWCAALVIGTALLAAYPWVRDDPRGELFALLGWRSEGAALGAALVGVVVLGVLLDRLRRRAASRSSVRRAPRPVLLAGVLFAASLAPSISPATVLVDSYGPVRLTESAPEWRRSFAPRAVSALALDTNLAQGADLEPGTPVATVELLDAGGEPVATWQLAAGADTAEWAAARSDLAGRFGAVAPPPWISVVAPDGTFFAQRFRRRFVVAVEERRPVSQLVIRRAAGLPPETAVSIYRLGLRR